MVNYIKIQHAKFNEVLYDNTSKYNIFLLILKWTLKTIDTQFIDKMI